MKDSTLLKLSLAIAAIGLFGLLLYGGAQKTSYSVAELDELMGQEVLINGTTSSLYTSKAGNTFFMVSDGTGQVNVVIFKNSGLDATELDNGLAVEIEGKVAEYEGALEIVASAFRVLS